MPEEIACSAACQDGHCASPPDVLGKIEFRDHLQAGSVIGSGIMKITVLSENKDVIGHLASHQLAGADLAAKFDKPRRIPGAAGSMWQLLVDLAVIGAPMSLVTNLLSDWIMSALQRSSAESKVRLVIREGDRTIEAEVSGTEPDAIARAITTAIEDAYRKS